MRRPPFHSEQALASSTWEPRTLQYGTKHRPSDSNHQAPFPAASADCGLFSLREMAARHTSHSTAGGGRLPALTAATRSRRQEAGGPPNDSGGDSEPRAAPLSDDVISAFYASRQKPPPAAGAGAAAAEAPAAAAAGPTGGATPRPPSTLHFSPLNPALLHGTLWSPTPRAASSVRPCPHRAG